jgi:hypothetical protein
MAYNVRHSKSVDHQPASGLERQANLLREVVVWSLGIAALWVVFVLVRRYLF